MLTLLVLLAFPTVSKANEGVVMMKGAGVSGACFAASVFVDGTYRVLATCRDLKTALSPEQNRYVVWLTDANGKTRRLGEIVNGKLATSTDSKFVELYVTAESDGYGNKPSDSVLLSGPVQSINFDSAEFKPGATLTVAPTPTPKNNAKVTPTVTVVADGTETTPNKGIGGALSTVLKIALFGFGALLLIVGVFSFISRKRAL
jgi:hypothetical protein